jgi:hypothetical protein
VMLDQPWQCFNAQAQAWLGFWARVRNTAGLWMRGKSDMRIGAWFGSGDGGRLRPHLTQANTRGRGVAKLRRHWRKGFPRVKKRPRLFHKDVEMAIMVLS